MSKRPRSSDNEAFDTVAIPVAGALDGVTAAMDGDIAGKVQSVVEWSARHFAAATSGAQDRPAEADDDTGGDDLVRSVARLESDIAAHGVSLLHDRRRQNLGYALGGALVGGLLAGAIVAALHARRR